MVRAPRFGGDAHVECPGRGDAAADAREGDGLGFGEIDEDGLLGDEDETLFEEIELALDGFDVGFDAGEALGAGD